MVSSRSLHLRLVLTTSRKTNDHVRVVVSSRTKEQPTSTECIDSDAMDDARGCIIGKGRKGAYTDAAETAETVEDAKTVKLPKETRDPRAR